MKSNRPHYGWIVAGVALGAALAMVLLPGWIPVLTASIAEGTAFWLLARVGGFVAYGLLWVSVVFGLLLTSKVARAWPGAQHAYAIHQNVSVLALVFTLFHALILLGDHYIGYSLRTLFVPFSSVQYRPLPVGLGQIGGYLLLIVTVSSYMRRRIGVTSWRVLHYATFGLFYLAVAHGVLAGSDSQAPWARVLYLSTGTITYALTIYRVLVAATAGSRESKELHVRIPGPHTSDNPTG